MAPTHITKVTLSGSDFNNMVTILVFSQFENMPVEKCIQQYLEPVYTRESIKQFEDILLGEDNVTTENLPIEPWEDQGDIHLSCVDSERFW